MKPWKTATLWSVLLVVAAYLLAAAAGWTAHQTNPNGVLLYTPPPGDPGQATPAFYVGFLAALAGVTLLAAGACLLALTLRLVLFRWPHAVRLAGIARLSAITGAATLAGIGGFVLFGPLLQG